MAEIQLRIREWGSSCKKNKETKEIQTALKPQKRIKTIFGLISEHTCVLGLNRMEKLTIVWERPFKLSEKIPPNLRD
jgi:hypothetical protein